jgi:hypothetical protein
MNSGRPPSNESFQGKSSLCQRKDSFDTDDLFFEEFFDLGKSDVCYHLDTSLTYLDRTSPRLDGRGQLDKKRAWQKRKSTSGTCHSLSRGTQGKQVC